MFRRLDEMVRRSCRIRQPGRLMEKSVGTIYILTLENDLDFEDWFLSIFPLWRFASNLSVGKLGGTLQDRQYRCLDSELTSHTTPSTSHDQIKVELPLPS